MGYLSSFDMDNLINEFLNEFVKIDILDYEKIESGGQGYTAIYIGNLEDEQEGILLDIGFEKVKDDLWIMEGFEIDILNLKDILAPYFEYLEKELWAEAINKRVDLDDAYRARYHESLFKTHYTIPKLVIKWYGKICLDEYTFNDFIQDLNKIFRESMKENVRGKIDFLKTLGALRNRIGHPTINPREVNISRKYIGSILGSEVPKYWFHYVDLQLSLIKDTINFLEDTNTEEGLTRMVNLLVN